MNASRLQTQTALCFLILAFLATSAIGQPREKLILTGGNVLAPDGTKFLSNHDVFIEGGRISKIGPTGILGGEGIKKIDCSGFYLLPGLIDLHTHFLLHPYNEAKWDDQVLREALEYRTIRGVVAARRTLEAGFTTIRDLGTEGAGFADVALRDAIRDELIPGPRIFAVTRAIVATGCYGPDGFDPRWDVPKGAQEATGPADVRKAVRQQIAAGADWIKVYADYRRTPSSEATPTFSQQELDALVDEAKSAGLQVAAHATVDEAITRAVKAGVATIEHGYDASLEVFTLMKDRGVVLCPTLAAAEAMVRYEIASRELQFARPGVPPLPSGAEGDQSGSPKGVRAESEPGAQATGDSISTATVKERGPGQIDNRTSTIENDPRIAHLREVFQRALQSGVTIACGSDAGPFPHGENARELELMVEFGMTPEQAIRAATLTAATVLRRENELGKIDAGYTADLIALRQNPLENIKSIRNPALVLKSGTIAVDRRQSEPRR